MNFISFHHFKGELLDGFLESGWFRMGNQMFTTTFTINTAYEPFAAHWLRYRIPAIEDSFHKKGNFQKISNLFSTEALPIEAIDTRELNTLFQQYRKQTKFTDVGSLRTDLGIGYPNFDTQVLTVRDNGRLIAAGIFDIGEDSTTSIKNIYHPAYRKLGMGIYLLKQELRYCQQNNYRWLYPGYIAPGITNYDYKIFPAFSEVYIASANTWLPYNDWVRLFS